MYTLRYPALRHDWDLFIVSKLHSSVFEGPGTAWDNLCTRVSNLGLVSAVPELARGDRPDSKSQDASCVLNLMRPDVPGYHAK